MFNNSGLRSLIREHGMVVTLRKKSTGSFNTTTGSVTVTNTDYSVKGYFYDDKPDIVYSEVVKEETRRIVIDVSLTNKQPTPEPTAFDQIIYSGGTADVVRVDQIRSAGKVMCYILHLRG